MCNQMVKSKGSGNYYDLDKHKWNNFIPKFHKYTIWLPITPFAPGDFAEKRILKLVEWFSGHRRAIKS